MGWIHADIEEPVSWGNSQKTNADAVNEKYFLSCAFYDARRAMMKAANRELPEITDEKDLVKLVDIFKGIVKDHPEYEDKLQDILREGEKSFNQACAGNVSSEMLPDKAIWYLDPWFIAYRDAEDGKENEWTIRSDKPMTHKEAEQRLHEEEEDDKRYVKMGDTPREFKIVKDSKDL